MNKLVHVARTHKEIEPEYEFWSRGRRPRSRRPTRAAMFRRQTGNIPERKESQETFISLFGNQILTLTIYFC